jgi:hypothetical protein
MNPEKVPSKGANTKCPHCSTVFFVAPREQEKSENVPVPMICPKCGFEQDATESCARCGIIYAKYRGGEERQDLLTVPTVITPPPSLDLVQRLLLLCGVLAIILSLLSGIRLRAETDKYLGHKVSNISPITRITSSMLPTSAIPEGIFVVFILYSDNKRRFVSQARRMGNIKINFSNDNKGNIYLKGIKDTIINIAIFLIIISTILSITTSQDHSERGYVSILWIFLCLILLAPLFIGFALHYVKNDILFYFLSFNAIGAEIFSFAILWPLLAFNHTSSMLLSDLQLKLYVFTPAIILVLVFIELYRTLRNHATSLR